MRRFLREPLLHVLLLGAAIFVAHGFLSKPGDEGPGRIVITRGQIENLADGFAKARLRPPTAEELSELVQDRVREEVYCREATALGMDKDDTIIRRRLRQKMEFTFDDLAAPAEPTDVDLNAYLQAHPDSFRVGPSFTFRQVYLNPERHGENLARDAVQLLASLSGPEGAVERPALGDSFLLGSSFAALPDSEVAKLFGSAFAAKLSGLPIGSWQGPIESGYGAHLVFVSERADERLPELAEIRDVVRREWESARRRETNEKLFQKLLEHYTVTIEALDLSAEQKGPAKGDAN